MQVFLDIVESVNLLMSSKGGEGVFEWVAWTMSFWLLIGDFGDYR